MSNERRAGETLSRLAFGLGSIAAKPKKGLPAQRPPNVLDVLTPEQKATRAQKQGLGGCSCSKRKVQ